MGERIFEPSVGQRVLLVWCTPGNEKYSKDRYGGSGRGSYGIMFNPPVLVEITGGSYMGGFDRVSNFFSWREVKPNGKLSREYCGYPVFEEYEDTQTVKNSTIVFKVGESYPTKDGSRVKILDTNRNTDECFSADKPYSVIAYLHKYDRILYYNPENGFCAGCPGYDIDMDAISDKE